MTEYHVGCGLFGIYAGRVNKNKDMWLSKSEVTNEVLCCAFEYLYKAQKEFRTVVDGKSYVMRIVPYKESEENNE